MAATTQQALAEALATIDAAFGGTREITAPKAYARHLEQKAQVEEIGRRQAEAIKSAPGYSAKLGCFISPKAEIDFLNQQLADASGSAPALKIAAE